MKIKNSKGITLISLVVTIIILLILAGVTIIFTLGENGIIKIAKYAKNEYQNAQNNEIDSLLNIVNIDEINVKTEESANTNINTGRCIYQDIKLTDSNKLLSYTSTIEGGPLLVVLTGGTSEKNQNITINCTSTADIQLIDSYVYYRRKSFINIFDWL